MKDRIPGKILWLASYPKSGNTWYRAFLTALFAEGKVDINEMVSDGIYSSRFFFNRFTDIDSTYLYEWEAKMMMADIFRHIFKHSNKLKIIKIHDAFAYDIHGTSFLPEELSTAAIYFIRNPLDVAGSLANHLDATLDVAIDLLNDRNGTLVVQEGNNNIKDQLPQYMSNWSRHVTSWLSVKSFPVYFLRYEDMLSDTLTTFKKSIELLGWQISDEQIEKAINAVSFEKLKFQEDQQGFVEKLRRTKNFFRKGTVDNWRGELTKYQAELIKKEHREVMELFRYV